MEQSATTGAEWFRAADLRSPRSRIAELTRRASRNTDLDKGRWTLCSIDPFLAQVGECGRRADGY